MFLPRRTLLPIGLLVFSLLMSQSPLQPLFESFAGGMTAHLLSVSTLFAKDVISLSQSSSLLAENKHLKERIMALEHSVSLLEEDKRQIERLAALEKRQHDLNLSGVICRVVGRDPSPSRHLAFLNKGRKDGIQLSMVVLGPQGLVGQIVEVQSDWSKVLLITDPDSKIGAILERSREAGLIVGQPNGLLTLEYLSPGADVRETDKVLTGGFGKRFPEGILIGEVVGFGRREEDLLYHAWVKPAEPVSRVEEVLCISP